jgi:hypothetical protein
VAIRDRDRKVLWSRAGNRCSICRTILVREGEVGEGLTVIGEECHIVSRAGTGPRAANSVEDIDRYDNLTLLCPNDHRLVDTLVNDYPVDRLRAIKSSHEQWVRTSLERSNGLSPLTIVRGEPAALRYLATAKELLNVVVSAEESSLDHENIASEDELELIAGFLQLVHDDAEVWDDYEPADRIRTTFELDREIKSLEEHGWHVFGERVRGRLRGGVSGSDTDWDTAYVRLVRADSPTIIRLDLAKGPNGDREAAS